MHCGRPLAILLLCFWSAAMPAGAQSPAADRVTVDSDSPAGREYALPLDAARQEAAPPSGGDDEANPGSSSRLFGEGIPPPETRSRTSTADAAPARQASLDAKEDASSSASAGTGSRVAVRRADVGAETHSGTTVAFGAVLVLAAGALVGVVLRRPNAKSEHDAPSVS